MYSIGSLFYAIYFFVSFPLFMRLDEEPRGKRWSLGEVRVLRACSGLVAVQEQRAAAGG